MPRTATRIVIVVGLALAGHAGALAQPPVGLTPAGDFETGLSPLGVAAADFDGDGILDLCTANSESGDVSVLFGNGDGTFEDAFPAEEVGIGPVDIAVGDLDGDGAVDIVVADNISGTIGVLLNDGDGSFAPVVETEVAAAPQAIVLGHFDDDRLLDAAFVGQDDGVVVVLQGDGEGGFRESDEILVGEAPTGLAAADLDGDGRPDLVVTNSEGGEELTGSFQVLRGLGEGKFEAAPEVEIDCDGGDCAPVAVAVGDLNGDGRPDLAIVNEAADTVAVFLNEGNLAFRAGAVVSTAPAPRGVVLADLNGDRALDVATTSDFQDKVAVLVGRGDGTFLPQPSTRVAAAAPAGSTSVTVVDASRFPATGTVQLGQFRRVAYTGKAGNTLTLAAPLDEDVPAQAVASLVFPTGTSPWGLVTGDFNDDGKPDLAATNSDGDSVTVLLNSSGEATPCAGDCRNDGEVTVDDLIVMVNIALGTAPLGECPAGDANGDGEITIDDLIVAVNNALNGCPLLQ